MRQRKTAQPVKTELRGQFIKKFNFGKAVRSMYSSCRGRCLHRPGRTGRFYEGLWQIRNRCSGTMWASSPTRTVLDTCCFVRIRLFQMQSVTPARQKAPCPSAADPEGCCISRTETYLYHGRWQAVIWWFWI